jgi:Spy/CpxP family protein refolding chaperone
MKKYLLLVICSVLFLGMAAFAQDVVKDSASAEVKGTGKYMSMKDTLGMTDEQSAKMKAINSDLMKKNSVLVGQVNAISKEIGDIMNADDPDLKKAETKVRELEKIRTQIMLNRLSAMKEVGKILTKEQKDKIRQMGAVNKGPKNVMPPKGK